jgi:hypothetical protein
VTVLITEWIGCLPAPSEVVSLVCGVSTGSSSMSAWNCISSWFSVMPPAHKTEGRQLKDTLLRPPYHRTVRDVEVEGQGSDLEEDRSMDRPH